MNFPANFGADLIILVLFLIIYIDKFIILLFMISIKK